VNAVARGRAVTLRTPDDADLVALAAVLPADVAFDPSLPDTGAAGLAMLRQAWRARAELAPARWRIVLAVEVDGTLVGAQDLKAADFPTRRIVETSSWLGTAHRGRGIAKAMRAMVLQLAFEELDAVAAESESAEGNTAALGVTRSLGYEPCGDRYESHAGVVEHMLWSRLTRERWALVHQGYGLSDVRITGVAACLPLLGLAGPPTAERAGRAAGARPGRLAVGDSSDDPPR